MKRSFRNEAEGRTWWVELVNATLRIGFSDDSEPGEENVRTRRKASAHEAREEFERLVHEQMAEGFAEVGAAPRETCDAFFLRLHLAWKSAAPHIASETWLHEVQALPEGFRDRMHREWSNARHRSDVPWPQAYEDASWLRMQIEVTRAPYLLGLRDPSAAPFSLHTLGGAPSDTPLLEEALLSLIESPVPLDGFMPGYTTTMCSFPFAAQSVMRLVELAHAADMHRASNAALLLGCSLHVSVLRAEIAEALLAWLSREDVPSLHVNGLIEHAVPMLGYGLHRDRKRPRTRAELMRLLDRVLGKTT
jgi:hypothetical protein